MNMRECSCRSLDAKDTNPGFDGAENGEKEYKKLRGMELHEEDADGWHYRGEGAANVVLSYHGSRPSFIGRILRIRKFSTKSKVPRHDNVQNDTNKDTHHPILSDDEQKLWSEWPAMAEATTPAAIAHIYACEIIQPLLGRDHVDAGLLVYLTPEFLETINYDIVANQHKWRQKDAQMEISGGVALLVADHSCFHTLPGVWINLFHNDFFREGQCGQQEGKVRDLPPTITFEIKPKWGFLPTAATIAEINAVKRHVPRFAMHQHLKLQQGKIRSLSQYSPLDLFSGTTHGIHKALLALFKNPQNNLRIFMDGVEVFGGPRDGGSTEKSIQCLEDKLEGVSAAPKGERVSAFQKLVAEILHKSKILGRLLSVQKLDAYDIEGVMLAYNKFLSSTDDADDGDAVSAADSETSLKTGSDALSSTLSTGRASDEVGTGNTRVDNLALETEEESNVRDKAWIQSLSWNDSRRVVRNYLIAATAKDCGIMLTLRPFDNVFDTGFPVPSASVAACPITRQQYSYRIAFLDLDLKHLKKIPFYHALDKEIVTTYKTNTRLDS